MCYHLLFDPYQWFFYPLLLHKDHNIWDTIIQSTGVNSLGHYYPGSCRALLLISLFYWYQLSHFIHHNSPIMWWKMNKQNNSYHDIYIIYWNKQHWIFYPSSCLSVYFFTQRDSSSVTSWNICFTIPIGFWMTEPEGFHCAGIYTFVQRTICFKQIEYQLWHLSSTWICSNDIDTGKVLLLTMKG